MVVRKNREILTGGKKYAQKAAKKHRVEEVVFDKDSRVEYLTGFHKRKVQRQKKAQEYIKEQERLSRIEERKQIRAERKKDMEKQLEDFNSTVKKITSYVESDDDDWSGFNDKTADNDKNDDGINEEEEDDVDDDGEEDNDGEERSKPPAPKPKGILHHTEVYKLDETTELLPESSAIIDDETTVTVDSLDNPAIVSAQQASVEALARMHNVDLGKSEKVLENSIKKAKTHAIMVGVAKPSVGDRIKQKKKKFRYLSKAERRENTRKERSKGYSRGKAKK
ncbi:hypothetical protein G9P44_005038 [Scheffersomyces stipitis]|nr:hypothetical protein G9P44_005038 [Scheffersomyces stipitis]